MSKLLGLILLTLFVKIEMMACSCSGLPTVKQSIKSSDIVVLGEVIKKEIVQFKEDGTERIVPADSVKNDFGFLLKGSYDARYSVVVTDSYKGKIKHDTITIITGLGGGGDCGFRFSLGQEYIIYGYHVYSDKSPIDSNIYYTNMCTRTTSEIDIELKELKKIKHWMWLTM